ncbi:RidA family protein [Natronolimnobius sp. AArcel1]|uniref:RidA family protein n=1 Tax=Natronolimnobius sp. AArcel1 TaxID=1679093 RepID=UPI0013EA3803|nr:RidA family protein [Natronolimnobius sp. AArcel1]NGM70639.1 RidA family protein [Natronolimnobius sp. AArcel1]
MDEVTTDDAPASIGPYSQGIIDGDTVYVSGQGPVDPDSGEIIDGDIQDETRCTMENVGAVLEAAGTSLDNVVKATVFVQDMDNYSAINEVYEEYLSEPYPARSAVQIEDLPVDIGVEIEVIATLE